MAGAFPQSRGHRYWATQMAGGFHLGILLGRAGRRFAPSKYQRAALDLVTPAVMSLGAAKGVDCLRDGLDSKRQFWRRRIVFG